MPHCISISHPDIQKLSDELGLHKVIVASRIALWQEKTGDFSRFPTAEEIATPVEVKEFSFNDTEKVSNMILNKLMNKTRPFFKRNRKNIKDEYWYNDDANIARSTANELLKNIIGTDESVNMNDSVQSVKQNVHEILSQDLVTKWQESLDNIKEWESFDTLDQKLASKRLLKDFVRNGFNSLERYSEENQVIIKDYFKSLFKENKYTSEKQGLYLANKIAEKRLDSEISRESNMRSMFNMKKKAMIGKYETLLNLAKLDPDYKQRIESKIDNEIDRRLEFQKSEFNKNPNISKVQKFRKLWNDSSFYKEQSDLHEKVRNKEYSDKIDSLFDNMNYDAEKGDVIANSTTPEFLNKVISNNSEYSDLAKYLLPFAKKHGVSISLMHSIEDGTAGRNEIKLGHGKNKNGEEYSYITDEDILIDYTSNAYKIDPERLVLHEIVHSLTSIYLKSEEYKDQLAKKKNSINTYMEYLKDTTREQRDIIRKGSYFFGDGDTPYAFTNAQEFVAEYLTNPYFIEMLKNVPAMEKSKFRSLFDEILSWIGDKIFGIKTDSNAYEQLHNIIGGILDRQSEFNFYADTESDNISSDQKEQIKTPYPQSFSNVKNLPFIDYKDLYKEYNLVDKNGERKSLPLNTKTKEWVDSLNQSPKYSFALIKDTFGKYKITILPKQDGQLSLFQLENTKPTAERIEALDLKLKQLLANLGVTVEDYNNFKDKYGKDAIGMFDIVNGIAKIAIDGKNANELTLAEETAHFIIEAMGQHPLAQRMLDLMRANDYYKEVLGENLDAYNKLYKGDVDLLVKEAAGQTLSQALVSNFKQENLNIPEPHLNIMQRLWNYVKSVFKNLNKRDLNQMINDTYGKVASEFMQGNSSFMEAITLGSDIRLFAISDGALNGLKTAITNARDASAKRLNVYKKKDIKRTAAIEELSLRKLEEHLEKQEYMLAALSVSEHARHMFTHVTKRIGELKTAIDNLELVGQDALLSLASTLRDMKSFSDSYLPMAKEIQSEVGDILDEEPDNADYKKIDEVLTEIVKQAEKLDKRYLDMARPLWAKYLTPFLYGGPITEDNLLESLKEGGKDITFVQRFIDSMAESGMPILQMLDIVVKDAKQEGRDQSYAAIKDLIAQRMELEKSGIKDTKWMYELKKDGTISGNDVYEYNYGDWQTSREAEGQNILDTIRKANKGLTLSEDNHELLDQIAGNDVLQEQYKRMWSYWFRNNSQANPNVDDIVEMKRSQMTEDEFNDWYEENTSVNLSTGTIYYIKELSVPSDKYKNSQFLDIQSNPAKKKYYDLSMKLKEDHDNKLPYNQRLGRLAPQTRTDLVEKIKKSTSLKEAGRNVKASFKEAFTNVEDDTDIGSRFKVLDERGRVVYFLPVHYTTKLKDMKDLSTDSTESLAAFIGTSNDYSKMHKIIDILELGRDIISNVQLQKYDSNGNPLKESINILGKKIAKSIKLNPKESNMKDRLDTFFKMNVYGQTRSEGTDYNIFGYKVNSEKMWDTLGKYTSLTQLALNIYSGIQNPIIGNANIRIEAISGQFYGSKAILMADKKYWSELPNNIANIASRNATDFLTLWGEKLETFQDFARKTKEFNMDRRTLVEKILSQNSLFVTNSSGEHQMQFRSSLALAYEVKLKDKDGKDITLLDAFDKVGNKLVLKEGLKKTDGTLYTERDVRAFKRMQNAVNNMLHGIYNDQDLLAIQQYGALRQVLMFRKFMRPGYNRRFRELRYNYELQAYTEGYYRTFGRFAVQTVKDLKRGQFLMAANWEKMSTMEKQNMLRATADLGYMMATMAFISFILPMMGGDDEDDWAAQMAAYQANRLLTELSFFIDPRQTLTILKSPAAGIQTINGMLNLITTLANPWTASEIIDRGKWKGYTRAHKAMVSTFPLYKNINDWAFPQDKLVYLTLSNK